MNVLPYNSAQSLDTASIQPKLSTATTSVYNVILAYSLIQVIRNVVEKYQNSEKFHKI
jgi:hypothetical protein